MMKPFMRVELLDKFVHIMRVDGKIMFVLQLGEILQIKNWTGVQHKKI